MHIPKVLAIVNTLTAVFLLIVVAVVADADGLGVTPSMIAEAAKNMSPEFGLDLLARWVESWRHRASVLKWLCYGALPVLAANAFCWATWRGEPEDEPCKTQ